eukprot:gene16324-11664_t
MAVHPVAVVKDSTAVSSAPDCLADSPGVGAENEAKVATDDVKLTEKAPDQTSSTAVSSAPDYMADSPGVGTENEATVATDDVKLTEKAPDQTSSTAVSSVPDYMADSLSFGTENEAKVATDDVKLTEKAPDQPVDRSTPPVNMAATNTTAETTSSTPMEDQEALRRALHSWASIAVDMTMLHSQLQAQQRVLDTLVSQTKECPSCIWLYPKRRDLRDWLRQPMERLFMDSLML